MDDQAIVIGLGANLPSSAGAPAETLDRAVEALDAADLTVARVSRYYVSEAVPADSGPRFVNAAAVLDSGYSPAEILDRLHAVERLFGRDRDAAPDLRWQPRPLDLDLLAARAMVLPDPLTQLDWMKRSDEEVRAAAPEVLILPHPRLHRRAFVLAPMADVVPRWFHPGLGMTAAELLAQLPAEARAGLTVLDR
ncbi:MAG: 2-amino-4-hydroxy-6-hydroxymethyldihydropteridine diphosphokinase [Pseudomonadota bacterium]